MVSCEQRERLLGQILMGVSSRAACDSLSILYCDLLALLDSDDAFRFAFHCAMTQRDALNRALEPRETE